MGTGKETEKRSITKTQKNEFSLKTLLSLTVKKLNV
jgi:hypothetical protein